MPRPHIACILIMISTLIFIGCATPREITRPSDPVEALRYDIDSILSDSIFIPTDAAIKVVSLDRNEVLYERNSRKLMRPASNTKLLTSAAALLILGQDHIFQTLILADSLRPDGSVEGPLYIKGFGNPDMTTTELDSMVWQLKAIGIKSISGNIVADASWFDDLYWGTGWMWDDEAESDEAGISALSVNKNCVKVSVIPGKSSGGAVQVLIDPTTSYVSLINTARTVADTALIPLEITRLYKERLNTLTVSGEIMAGKDTVKRRITVWRPELYTATLLKERLEASGIAVRGQPTIGVTLPWSRELAYHHWPLDTMIVNLNKASDNLSAENTLKSVSVARGGIPGSAKHGLFQVNETLAELGIDTTQYFIVDGSGASHYNLLTAETLVQLLTAMTRKSEIFPLFYRSLPIAGVDGTLEKRMRGTRAEGNLRGKTGSLTGISNLSGYVTTADGEHLVFSMLMQDFILPIRLYRNAQDQIGALLAGFTRN